MKLTKRQQEMQERYTEVRVSPGQKDPHVKAVLLKVGDQRFYVADRLETEGEARWYQAMLGKALAALLEGEKGA